MTGILAAAAIALGMITMGCDEGDNGDITLYAPNSMTKAELIEAVASTKGESRQLTEVGIIDGNTGYYVFDNGLVVDPADVVEVEPEVVIPEGCGEECFENAVPREELADNGTTAPDAAHADQALVPEQYQNGDEYTIPGPEGTLVKFVRSKLNQPSNPEDIVAMYLDDDGLVACWLVCENVPHPI
jgi:hypothetical protein